METGVKGVSVGKETSPSPVNVYDSTETKTEKVNRRYLKQIFQKTALKKSHIYGKAKK